MQLNTVGVNDTYFLDRIKQDYFSVDKNGNVTNNKTGQPIARSYPGRKNFDRRYPTLAYCEGDDMTSIGVTRFLWLFHFGEIPPHHTIIPRDGDYNNRKADNLQLVSIGDKIKLTKFNKTGSNHPSNALFTDEQVKAFRMEFATTDITMMEMARREKTNKSTISSMLSGKKYKNVPLPSYKDKPRAVRPLPKALVDIMTEEEQKEAIRIKLEERAARKKERQTRSNATRREKRIAARVAAGLPPLGREHRVDPETRKARKRAARRRWEANKAIAQGKAPPVSREEYQAKLAAARAAKAEQQAANAKPTKKRVLSNKPKKVTKPVEKKSLSVSELEQVRENILAKRQGSISVEVVIPEPIIEQVTETNPELDIKVYDMTKPVHVRAGYLPGKIRTDIKGWILWGKSLEEVCSHFKLDRELAIWTARNS